MTIYPNNARALYKTTNAITLPLAALATGVLYFVEPESAARQTVIWGAAAFIIWKGYLWLAVRNLLKEDAEKWTRLTELMNASWHRGIHKRIDENRELLEFLQTEAPELLKRCWWIEGWLETQDRFLVELLVITRTRNPLDGLSRAFPRPWPGLRKESE